MNPARRIPVLGRIFRRKKRKSQGRIYRGIESVRRTATPFYYLIRRFFQLVIRTQHSEIQAIGLENIPPDGSVLLVGNHPNSYLDYFNLINIVRHPVATAAKDTITQMTLIGPVLKDHMLMVPISRKQDQDVTGVSEDERRNANEQSVREAVELLVRGRLFNIFAEGRSTDSRKLNNIKLGFMHMGILAEKEFNFRLNLRIVPYGFYYDRINKFQSAVCIVFGRPIKLNSLVDIPDDFLSLSDSERSSIEKKLMLEGKKRLQHDIEELIISIPDRQLVDLIDDATALYVMSPHKYMGPYANIAEKYRLSKVLSDSIQGASQTSEGRDRLEELKRQMSAYKKESRKRSIADAITRREHSWAEFGYHVRVLLKGVILSPLIVFGYIANFIPRMVGRFMRYKVIDIQKRPKVDGDEQAIVGATVAGLITYPLFAAAIVYACHTLGGVAIALEFITDLLGHFLLTTWMSKHILIVSIAVAIGAVYTMARLWRFSLHHGQELRSAIYWVRDWSVEVFRKNDVHALREMRYEIIDTLDFIIGDYYN